MDIPTDGLEAPWGAKVNTRNDFDPRQRRPCPPWVNWKQKQKWNHRGLIVWNHTTQQLIRFYPSGALEILAQLRTTTDWPQTGITIGEPIATEGPKFDAQGTLILPRTIPNERESLHVPPTQAHQLLALLVEYEATLHIMAQADMQDIKDKLVRTVTFMMQWQCLKQSRDVDLSTRPLPWIKHPGQWIWTCDLPPNRVTVSLPEYSFEWQGCLECPHEYKVKSPPFTTFDAVLTWGEQELRTAAEKAVQKARRVVASKPARLTLETLTVDHRDRLVPFWIEPQALARLPVQYRISMHLHLIAHERRPRPEPSFLELSFGEKHFMDVYPTPAQLAVAVQLNRNQVDLVPSARGLLYHVMSLTVYHDMAVAAAQAQRLWEQSTIPAAVRDGYASGAVYGIEETESGWGSWIGGCGEWPREPTDREVYLAREAFNLTLIHALDLAGYRARLALSEDEASDALLYVMMHEDRAAASALPPAARAESAQWLRDQRVKEMKKSDRSTTAPAHEKTKRRGAKTT